MRKRTSIIWQCSDKDFIEFVNKSKSMTELLRFFRLENKGGNHNTCKKRIKELGLIISHFLIRKGKRSNHPWCLSKEDVLSRLIKNSKWNRYDLKKSLIKFNLLEYKCDKCKNAGFWENEKLSLQLEHKNGISNDNRLENLCFLCPNCHSQTLTYAGKRFKKDKIKISEINPNWRQRPKPNLRKIIRPDKESLESLIKTTPILTIAKQFGVSDNTIRKWAKYYGLDCKELSPRSRKNYIKKEKISKTFFPKSKYLYVSFNLKRQKWTAHIKEKKTKKSIFHKRFDTELEAAQAVAKYFNSENLLLRPT